MSETLTVEQVQGDIARLEAWSELRDGPVMMRKADALAAFRALLAAWEENKRLAAEVADHEKQAEIRDQIILDSGEENAKLAAEVERWRRLVDEARDIVVACAPGHEVWLDAADAALESP